MILQLLILSFRKWERKRWVEHVGHFSRSTLDRNHFPRVIILKDVLFTYFRAGKTRVMLWVGVCSPPLALGPAFLSTQALACFPSPLTWVVLFLFLVAVICGFTAHPPIALVRHRWRYCPASNCSATVYRAVETLLKVRNQSDTNLRVGHCAFHH